MGMAIVEMLTRFVEAFPYHNTVVGIMPTRGLREFYARHGYKAQSAECPAMLRWVGGDS